MLLIYAVSASVTGGTHLITVFGAPSPTDPKLDINLRQFAMTEEQIKTVAKPFILFLGVPLIMIVDMTFRILALMKPGLQKLKGSKKLE